MPSFHALAVKGDSFFLSTGSRMILVDGGHQSAALLKALGSRVTQIDVVICTHGDNDHAGGLTDLLTHPSAPRIGEFWLPGQWSDHIEPLLLDPQAFVDQLGEEIYELLAERPDFDPQTPYEQIVLGPDEDADDGPPPDRNTDSRPAWANHETSGPDPEWWSDLAEKARAQGMAEPTWTTPPAPASDSRGALSVEERRKRQLVVVDAIDAAELIYKIAMQAAQHRVPVRWFDFEAFAKGRAPSGGLPGVLEPINACELTTPPVRARSSLAYYIALSRINRQSLVFHAVETPDSPGVLFCGDSPLKGGRRRPWPGFRLIPTQGIAATAPHHGRASNAKAYAIVDSWGRGGRALWVRAGGVSPPCPELQKRLRICTECKGVPLRRVDLVPATPRRYGWWSRTGICLSSC